VLPTEGPTDQPVAVKVLVNKPDTDPERCSFVRELEILANNTHSATLRLLGFGFTPDGFPMIITGILSNGTLGSVLKRQYRNDCPAGWNPAKASICIFGICVGMAHLHSQSMPHRDLKPDNVFLNDQFELVIVYFGLSRHMGAVADQPMALGTPLYLAPELHSDAEKCECAIDVFPFSTLFYWFFEQRRSWMMERVLSEPSRPF
jgi:serine/threonine-protein kinase